MLLTIYCSYAEFVLSMSEVDTKLEPQPQKKPIGRRKSYDEVNDDPKKSSFVLQQNKSLSLKQFFGGRAPILPSDPAQLV